MPSALDALAMALLTYAGHSALACAIALVVARVLRRPQERDLVWKAALVAPLFTATAITASAALGTHGGFVDLGMAVRRALPMSLPARKVMVGIVDDGHGQDVIRQMIDPVTAAVSIAAIAVATGCVLVGLSRLSYRRRRFRRALASRQGSGESVELENGRRASITTSSGLPTPVALGRDEICLPAHLTSEFSSEYRRALVAHEAAHLARHDPVWFFAVDVIAALSAFQPLVHVVVRAFRRDVELICDEAAVAATGDGPALIGALSLLASPFDPMSPLHGAATAHDGSPLVARAERIARLTMGASFRRQRGAAALIVAVLVVLICAVPAISSAPRASEFPSRPQLPHDLIGDAVTKGAQAVVVEQDAIVLVGGSRVVRRVVRRPIATQ